MKAKVLKPFFDEAEGVDRREGEVLECTSARFKEIDTKLPTWIEEVKETPAKKTAKKKTGK